MHENIVSHFAENTGSLSKNMETLVFNKFRDTRIAKSLLAPELTRLLEFLTGYTKELVTSEIFNNSFFQSVTLDKASDKKDPQQNFHIDTFYPAFKFWYFPEPVTLKDAPFEYVPGSHCLPLEVLLTCQTDMKIMHLTWDTLFHQTIW